MATIQKACEAILDDVLTLKGIRQASDAPEEQYHAAPFAVCYPLRCRWDRITDWTQESHVLSVEIHQFRVNLAQDYMTLIGYGDTLPALLWNDINLNSNVAYIGDIRGSFGADMWGGLPTLRWRFEVTVTLINVI